MKPRLMPNLSSRTLAVVARQLVVHEALLMMRCLAGSYAFSLTPSTTVTSGSLAGAVMMTFLAPAWRCLEAVAVSRKMPVDSTTTSTPSSFQGRLAGSFSAVTRTSRPLTKMAPSLALTSAGRLPCTESCLSRCESVLASARSLTPTTSMSLSLRAVRKNTRPIRPKPLTPTRMLMEGLLVETRGVTGRIISNHARHAEDADGSRAGPAQRPAAFGGRGAGRQDVIDDHDMASRDARARHEGVADVGSALVRAEIALAGGGPHAREPAGLRSTTERRSQALGDQLSLIEPALALTGVAEGNRDQRVDGGGQVGAALLEHEIGQRTSERPPLLELERVERVAKRPLVPCGRPRVVPDRRLGPARPTQAGRPVGARRDGGEGRQRREGNAARVTERRIDARNGVPARRTEWIAPPRSERRRADRTQSGIEEVERSDSPGLHTAFAGSAPGRRGADGVPAAAARATILPGGRRRSAGGAGVGPVERVAQAQGPPILGEGLARLTATLEDRTEECVDDRQVGRAHLDLLELIGGLVQHLELKVDAAERDGEGEIVGRSIHGRSIQGDHAARSALLAIDALEPRQHGQRGILLGRSLPRLDRFLGVTPRFEGVSERERRRHESRLGLERVLEVADGGRGAAASDVGPAELVVNRGQPGGLGASLGAGHDPDQALLDAERFEPGLHLHREITQAAQRAHVVLPALDGLAKEAPRLLAPSRMPGVFGSADQRGGFRIVVGRQRQGAEDSAEDATDEGDGAERRDQ